MATIIKLFKKEEVADVLQRLKDFGIIVELSLHPDSGFKFSIVNKLNVRHENTLNECRIDWQKIEEVISAAAYEASVAYPESLYAVWYHKQVKVPH